jgi:hypothetical protein
VCQIHITVVAIMFLQGDMGSVGIQAGNCTHRHGACSGVVDGTGKVRRRCARRPRVLCIFPHSNVSKRPGSNNLNFQVDSVTAVLFNCHLAPGLALFIYHPGY